MIILARLSQTLATAVTGVLTPRHHVVPMRDWPEVHAYARQCQARALLVDPDSITRSHHDHLAQFRADFPSIPILVYCPITHSAMQAVVAAVPLGVQDVILHGLDDSPQYLTRVIERAAAESDLLALLGRLLPATHPLSPRLHDTLVELFRHPHRFFMVDDVARHARMSRRAFDRIIPSIGITSASHLLAAARLFNAFDRAGDRGVTLTQRAKALGYRDARALNRHAMRLLHVSPKHWSAVDRNALIERLVHVCVAPQYARHDHQTGEGN